MPSTASETSQDTGLFAAIKAGEKQAFDALFRSYYQYLCNYAFQMLKEREASEEVVQEMFFSLWEKRQQIDIHTSPKSYLFRSVHNRCLNIIKHIDIREQYKDHNEKRIALDEQEVHSKAEENELSALIAKSVNELPTERKKIFQLSRYEGLKNKEIADTLGISIKTVENQMGKALKFLREQLSEYLPVTLAGAVIYIIKQILA